MVTTPQRPAADVSPPEVKRLSQLALNWRVYKLLVIRDLKLRYVGSVLGYLWTVLDPLMMAGVYYFVFKVLFNRGGAGMEPYIVFLLAGMLPWNWLSGVITESTRALTNEAKLVRSAGIPREIWVLRIVGSKFLEFMFAVPVLLAFMLIYHADVHVSWHAVIDIPLATLIGAVLVTGIGLAMAPLSVMYRDLARVVRIILRVLFYLSPIIYSATAVTSRAHAIAKDLGGLYEYNPFVGILELYRRPLFPHEFVGWSAIVKAAFIAVVVLGLGVWVFRRLEGNVLKQI